MIRRRRFLRLLGMGTGAAILEACARQTPAAPPALGLSPVPSATEAKRLVDSLTPQARATLAQVLAGTPTAPTAATPEAAQDMAAAAPAGVSPSTTASPEAALPSRTPSPELGELAVAKQAVVQLIDTLKKARITAKAEELLAGIEPTIVKDKDGVTLEVAKVTVVDAKLGKLAGRFPLIVNTEQGWQLAHPRNFGNIGTHYDSPYYPVSQRDSIFANTQANYNIAAIDRLTWFEVGGQTENDYSGLNKGINAVKNAKEAGMQIWVSNLLDPLSTFANTFLRNLRGSQKEEMTRLVIEHLIKVVTPIKGEVQFILPITESRPDDSFARVMGEDYLITVFQTLRGVDPKAKLIYNDGRNHMTPGLNGTDYGQETKWTQSVAEKLKDKGLIDGVGFQMHLYADQPLDVSDMQKIMAEYQKSGIPVYITEMDVDMSKGSGDEVLQAQMYYDGINGFLTSPASSRVINLWDGAAGDRNSWLERDGSADAAPTPFHDDLTPKLAFYAIMKAQIDAMEG